MNILSSLLPHHWVIASHLLLAGLLALAVWTAPWRQLKENSRQHLWFATITVLMLFWSLRAGVKPGLEFHLLGATAFTLMFGWRLALLGLTMGAVGLALFQQGTIGEALSLNVLFLIALPVATSHAVWRLAERRLPTQPFVYIFISAFGNAALAMILTGAAVTGLYAAASTYPLDYLLSDYLPYFILLAFAEALLTGSAATLMLVYFPGMLVTFDDGRYLRRPT